MAKFKIKPPSPTALEDIWLRRATSVAIEQARAVVTGGDVHPNTPIGRLSETEWGWIVSAILFGWIKTRAEQATDNGAGPANAIRTTGLDPDPWDVGAIDAILWQLAEGNVVDWSKPLAALSREEMLLFLNDALTLVRKAIAARDLGQTLVTQRAPAITGMNGSSVCEMQIPDDLSIPSFLRRGL